jgi:hypothetical protein
MTTLHVRQFEGAARQCWAKLMEGHGVSAKFDYCWRHRHLRESPVTTGNENGRHNSTSLSDILSRKHSPLIWKSGCLVSAKCPDKPDVPRLAISFITCSQNFAPSLCSIQSLGPCLKPTASMPIARYTVVLDQPLVAHLHSERIEEYDCVGVFQRLGLPCSHFIDHLASHGEDQVRPCDFPLDCPQPAGDQQSSKWRV